MAGRCLLFGEYLAGKDVCMRADICSKSLRVQCLRGPGAGCKGMHVSWAGRCLRPKAVWELP